MADDLDFLDEYGYPRNDDGGEAGHHRGGGRHAPQVRSSTPLSRVAVVLGLLAVGTAGLWLAYAVAPTKMPAFTAVFADERSGIAAAAFAILSLILGITARLLVPREIRSHSIGSWSIVCFFATLVLIGCTLVVQNLFPNGIIQETVRDEAPSSSVSGMEQGMEQTAGTCVDGWTAIGVSEYPGVSSIKVCKNPRMAFIVFSNASAASLGRGIAEQKIASLLEQYQDNSQSQGDWRILNGKQWMAVAQASQIEALQKKWGGTVGTIE